MPFITALLVLTSCEFLNKKTTEKAVSSKRKIASVNPYQNPSRNQISVSNKAVSAVVLVKDQKPICTLSVAKAPHLVPESLKVDPRRNTLDLKLPQCRQQEASMIKRTIGEAIVLDKHGGYRTAGPPFALGAASSCFIGVSASLVIDRYGLSRAQTKEEKKESAYISGIAAATAHVIGELNKFSFMKNVGMAGMCAVGTNIAVYLFEKE